MPRVIAIAQPPGPEFIRELTRAWAAGDAVLPVDPRLPLPAARALLDALRPARLVDESGEHSRLLDPIASDDGDALVVATSGTTGEPKGVVLTHAAIQASAEASHRRLEVDPGHDVWLAVLPVAHIGGLSVITRALVTGTPVVFDIDDPVATLTAVVPTQANRLDLSRLRAVLVGGSSDWRDRPPNVIRTYGMTETGSGIAYDGRPLDGVEVRIDAGGQIHVKGPVLLRAYRDGTDPKNREGWLATGDAGWFDPEGRLCVAGRMGDCIVTGGEKVWPAAVESALLDHPGVRDVAVAGRFDAEWGQRVVAWVVPADEAAPPVLDELREHVKMRLPRYAAPRSMVVLRSIPRTALGKVRREVLDNTC